MDRIYNRAEDKNCANIILYANGLDNKAYIDKECTVQCKSSELMNAFKKGCIISSKEANQMIIPFGLAISESDKTASLKFVAEGIEEGSVILVSLEGTNDVAIDDTNHPKKQ